MKRNIIIILAIIVFTVVIIFSLTKLTQPKTEFTKSNNQIDKPTTQAQTFNKDKYSLTDPTSIWVIVNKQRSIPESFTPDLVVPDVQLRLGSSDEQMQLSSTAEPALKELFNSAKTDSITLVFGSGYRSNALQKQFYDSYKAKDGQEYADTYSARPNHSEHRTGLAIDITNLKGECHLEICFEETPEGKWLANNAYKYGFIIRYPKDKQNKTGYQYEPWHIRYVGKELANEINNTQLTLEEFFGLQPALNYN